MAAGILALTLVAPAAAQDAVDQDALEASIDKGLTWLRGLQQADGSFGLPPGTDTLETGFPMGYSALATLTLLKCGVAPDDPAIARAFDHLYSLPARKTYSVSMLLLAIEARFAPPPEDVDEKKGYGTSARRRFGRGARKVDKAKVAELVGWLLAHRSKQFSGGWRYPQGEIDQDNSNTQYAMLALKGARRLGADVPLDVFADVADFFVAQQDRTGPAVPGFPIPAADGPILDMVSRRARDKAVERDQERRSETRERDPQASESLTLYARGWSYEPREVEPGPAPESREGDPPPQTGTRVSTGSMTSSGVAALCIAKSELELDARAWRPRAATVEAAIRDGVAWLAKHWSPTDNPRADGGPSGWKYYYLYSVERAGVLAGTYRFGPRDWWEEGAAHLLDVQEPAGTWPDAKGLSRLSRTCFALLFLRRATVPLVPLPPKRVMTGRRG